MILVFGAAGACGAAVVRTLAQRQAAVRGFVRGEVRAAPARAAGANEIVIGNLRDPASVRAALEGAQAVFYVAPRFASDEGALGRMVVREAARSGVRRFVYQSAMHASAQWLLHHEQKRQVEEALYEVDMEFTILQPARFMHLVVAPWRKIVESGIYAEPFSADAPIADVDYQDVAEVAARALTDPGYAYASFELCAEGMLNRHQRVVLLSEAMGRPVRSGDITVDEWLAKAAITDPYEREARTRMFEYYDRHGFRAGNPRVLRALLGREPGCLRSFLARTAAHMKQEAAQPAWAG
jgi:uncharacterized protein YbjT (DUF2867 family)